ncbi:MAG: RluA family pseudouridine synthase [Planctomycetales bacterium]|nr:RluA family pseudouridine synthase [Planctomycetales bacterium]
MGHDDLRLDVLFEDNHLLVINKPAGLATMGVAEGAPSVLQIARRYLKDKYAKPGNVYVGIVSRLDAPVTGLLILARTSKAASRLTAQFRRGEVEKDYWALVDGSVDPPQGTLHDWVRKDERHRRMHLTGPHTPGAQEAVLAYRTLAATPRATLLEIRLHTGRKHQIRVQLSHAGHPILGDRKYGSRRKFPAGIGLHGRRLVLQHPVRRQPLELVAPLPPSWRGYADLGGDRG